MGGGFHIDMVRYIPGIWVGRGQGRREPSEAQDLLRRSRRVFLRPSWVRGRGRKTLGGRTTILLDRKECVGSSTHNKVHPTWNEDTDNRLRRVEGIPEDVQW